MRAAMYNPQRTQRVKKGEVVTMTVHILDNSYSKRVKGQSWVMFNRYNGDVYSSRKRAMKMLSEMAKSVSADPECYDAIFVIVGKTGTMMRLSVLSRLNQKK